MSTVEQQIFDLVQLVLSQCLELKDAVAALQHDLNDLLCDDEGSCASEFLEHSDDDMCSDDEEKECDECDE